MISATSHSFLSFHRSSCFFLSSLTVFIHLNRFFIKNFNFFLPNTINKILHFKDLSFSLIFTVHKRNSTSKQLFLFFRSLPFTIETLFRNNILSFYLIITLLKFFTTCYFFHFSRWIFSSRIKF